MLYRRFTIISLLVLGITFMAVSFMNEALRNHHRQSAGAYRITDMIMLPVTPHQDHMMQHASLISGTARP